MTSFKIFIKDEIRRFRLEDSELSYEKFIDKLRQNIPAYHLEMKTLYEDSDKDKIVFSCQMEFSEMIQHIKQTQGDGNLIKVWIVDSDIPYFKDGTVEVVKLYQTGNDNLLEQLQDTTSIQERITTAISRLFPDNTILPYHIPSYLKDILSVNTTGVADVELNIPVEGLISAINDEALRLMDSPDETDLTKSKLLLESLAILNPDNPNVYYNLACAESLLRNVQSSLHQLETAVKLGYNNFQHMLEDKDLDFLKLHDQYNEFVNNLFQSKVIDNDLESSFNAIKIKEPVPVEEPVIINEPVVEEKKDDVVEKEPLKWGDEIQVLKGMGFQLEESVFIDILDHHKGNLQTAVQDLI